MSLVDKAPGPHFFTKPLVSYDGKVPFIVTDLIAQLQALEASKAEGIFRLSAQKSKVEELCLALDRGRVKDLSNITDVHLVAGALKRYIRELSMLDPLIGADIADDVLTAIQSSADDDAVNRSLRELVAKGPISRRNTLAFLMKYLNTMVKDSSVSLMDPSNLAIVLTPALFPRTDSLAGGSALKAVEIMIRDFDTIFREMWCNSSVIMTDMDIEIMAEPDVDIEDAKIESLKREIRAKSRVAIVTDDLCEVLGLVRPTREAPPLPNARGPSK